jgi:hypothetical protein
MPPSEDEQALSTAPPTPVAAKGTDRTHVPSSANPKSGDSTIDFAELGLGSPEKSISLSSIDSLPRGQQNFSFVGGVSTDDDSSEIELSEVHIDLGTSKINNRSVDADRLDSFIKKKSK